MRTINEMEMMLVAGGEWTQNSDGTWNTDSMNGGEVQSVEISEHRGIMVEDVIDWTIIGAGVAVVGIAVFSTGGAVLAAAAAGEGALSIGTIAAVGVTEAGAAVTGRAMGAASFTAAIASALDKFMQKR